MTPFDSYPVEGDYTGSKQKPRRDVEAVKAPPNSIEAEQAVLGGLLLENNAWDDACERLNAIDFYRKEHQVIFRAMESLAERGRPFDAITLADVLRDQDQLDDIGGDIYLLELANSTPSVANIKAYADIVRERSILRQMIGVAHEIADAGYHPDGQTVTDLLDQAESKVFKIAEQGARGQGPQRLDGLVKMAVDKIDQMAHSDSEITGLSTGFTDLDKMTTGLQTADLVIVAGRPSMGKTCFAMNLAESAAIESKLPVLVFSMEMPGDHIAMRMLSSLGSLEQQRLRSGQLRDEDWSRLSSSVSLLSEANLYIDDTPGLTPGEMRARARRLAREQGQLGLIVVDYLQLMRVSGNAENRATEISEISRSLKAIAKELRVPMVALSQLNRSLEQRTDKRPVMSDLRESGAIEQDADLILFIYRDEVYHPETPDKGTAEVIIAKQRNGPIGKIRLTFQGQFTRFDNLANRSHYEGA